MAAPFLAPALIQLRTEVNQRWPGRDRTSDGWIGDASHSSRVSDHNPDSRGMVHAIDVDEDGIPTGLLLRATITDPRTSYVIYERLIYQRIYGFKPRAYTGINPHDHHLHVSLRYGDTWEPDRAPWFTDAVLTSHTTPIPGVDIPATAGALPAPITPEDDIVASIEDLRTVVREELSAADVLEALDLKTGFRFSCQGAVYFASLITGAYYWVPGGDQPHHTQLINLEVREIGEVLPIQRDTISSLCERAKLSFLAPAVAAAPDAATIAAAIPADLAKQVADELAHRLTNGA